MEQAENLITLYGEENFSRLCSIAELTKPEIQAVRDIIRGWEEARRETDDFEEWLKKIREITGKCISNFSLVSQGKINIVLTEIRGALAEVRRQLLANKQ